jgi:hypothetical protein
LISKSDRRQLLDKLIKHKNIINYIKAQKLSWFGHVQRVPDTRTVKKIFNWKPLSKRSQGRLKYRWEGNIKQDICQKKIKKTGQPASRIEESGKRSLRRPKLSTRKCSVWKKKKKIGGSQSRETSSCVLQTPLMQRAYSF